jgi:putative transposase
MVDIHAGDPEFGYRFIADEVTRRGLGASENRVHRLCRQQRIWSVTTRKGRSAKREGPPVHDDLVQRAFNPDALDRLWLTDITEHPTAEGKLYLCAVKDACSNRIVGYATGPRMTARLAVAALLLAIVRRNPTGTVVVHSDRGSQFRSRDYVSTLNSASLKGSMGRVGAAGDNAAMESFFSLLQKKRPEPQELGHKRRALKRDHQLDRADLHHRRRQRALGKLTPIEFETLLRPMGAVA